MWVSIASYLTALPNANADMGAVPATSHADLDEAVFKQASANVCWPKSHRRRKNVLDAVVKSEGYRCGDLNRRKAKTTKLPKRGPVCEISLFVFSDDTPTSNW